jgi:hypothetical protein
MGARKRELIARKARGEKKCPRTGERNVFRIEDQRLPTLWGILPGFRPPFFEKDKPCST